MSSHNGKKDDDARSSITTTNPESGSTSARDPRNSDNPPLQEEVVCDQASVYSDDTHAPQPKSPEHTLTIPTATLEPPTPDPNLVTWDGPDDPENPQTWSVLRKWAITAATALMTLCVTFGSTAPSIAVRDISVAFHVSEVAAELITAIFLVAYILGPIVFGPSSELIGRRPVMILSMALYAIFQLGQALAHNFATLIIIRFLTGFFAVAPLTNSGGIIADMWGAEGRGPALNLFVCTLFMGPVMGPIVSGYIIQSGVTWRWIFWVMMIFGGVSTGIAVCLPETYAPVLLLNKAKKLRKADPELNAKLYAAHERQDWSWKGVLKRTLYMPFKMLAMEPILVLTTLYLSLVYGLLYGLFEAFPIIFGEKRGFSVGSVGLTFIPIGVGSVIGSIITHYVGRKYNSLVEKWRGFPPAEERLYGGMIAGPLLVIGIFWLGWAGAYPSVHWIVPELGAGIIGICVSLTFHSFLSYTVDTYLMYSASAFAANTMIRSAIAAAFPLFTAQMFHNLGTQWASTLLGLIALLLGPSAFLFYKYGAKIRTRSKFAPCVDLKIAKILEQEEKGREEV
ncbi:MFS polyamine transporter [Tricholoma matsutake]|nr:MFS polyamine transporter [Tricholoma matsutake 945]